MLHVVLLDLEVRVEVAHIVVIFFASIQETKRLENARKGYDGIQTFVCLPSFSLVACLRRE